MILRNFLITFSSILIFTLLLTLTLCLISKSKKQLSRIYILQKKYKNFNV